MDRRFFFSSLFFLLAAPHPCGAQTTVSPKINASKPYAASDLEDTDPELFRQSMMEQWRNCNIPDPPEGYAPFPEPGHVAEANSAKVYGEDSLGSNLDSVLEYFNAFFPDRKPCHELLIRRHIMAWRVFLALHETAHHIAFNTILNGLDLNQQVFNDIYHITNQKPEAYIAKLEIEANTVIPASQKEAFGILEKREIMTEKIQRIMALEPKLSMLLVAKITYPQIYERIADASAVLYILSNYGNTPENRIFLLELINLRTGFKDIDHNTVSSIRRALKIFSQHPVRQLSIVETTLWAADIVRQQPEFKQSIDQQAAKIRHDFLSSPLSPSDAKPRFVTKARDLSCLWTPHL